MTTTADKEFKGAAVQTTTTNSINSSDTAVSIASATGWPTGAQPFTVVIARGTGAEEKILCSARSGTSLTLSSRGYDNTAAASHATGATIEHCIAATDFDALFNHATNTAIDDHTQYLKKTDAATTYAPVAATSNATVATNESTTSSSFGDLATVGPSVTLTVPASGKVLVTVSADINANNGSMYSNMGFALSGANTLAASQAKSVWIGNLVGTTASAAGLSRTFLLTGLTAGSTTFKAKYQCIFGGTSQFGNREIIVQTCP